MDSMDTMVYDPVESPTSSDEFMLTTVDNPYDPFTEWDNWYAYDEQTGYHTTGLMARMALTSNELTDEENEIEINHAVETIFDLFPGLYKKVKRSN